MSADFNELFPPYPLRIPQRFDGDLPPPSALQPPDMRASSMNPAYSVYAGTFGRAFAGLDGVQMQSADEGISDYPNELDYLQQTDDVQGNGMFDPPGTHGNVHPDQGIFADHESLPGYVAREQFYTPSEVVDATTGGQVMYVPAGAVSIDDAQRRAFNDRLMWELPPGVNPYQMFHPRGQSTVIPKQAEWGIGADDAGSASPMKMFLYAGVAGISVGLLLALVIPKR